MRFILFLWLSVWPFTSHALALIEELMLDAKAIQFDAQGKMAQQLEIKKIFHEEIILYKEKINFHELERAPDAFNQKIYDYDWKNLYKQYKVIYE